MQRSKKTYPGTIQVYETQSGRRFRALAKRDGKLKSLGSHTTEDEAIEAIRRFVATPKVEAPKDYRTHPCLFLWAPEWSRRRHVMGQHKEPHKVDLTINNRILSHSIAQLPLSQITRKHVREWLNDQMLRNAKNKNRPPRRQTIVNSLGVLRGILRDAVEEELIASNPCVGVKVPKEKRTDKTWDVLTMDELKRVLAAECLTEQNRNLLQFSAFTGLRAGEVFGLRWSDVDLEARAATIRFSYDGAVKNGEVHSIPLLHPAVEALKRQQLLGLPYDYVFPGRAGRCRHNGANAQFKDALKEAGITRRVRIHDLRHTYASFLVSGAFGKDFTLYQTSALLRHKSSTMTARYAHLTAGNVSSAVHAVEFTL